MLRTVRSGLVGRLLVIGLCVAGIGAGPALATPATFAGKVDYAAGTKAYSVATGDLNHDGTNDLVVANVWGNDVSVYIGNGDGSFQDQSPYATGTGPVSVVIADVNRDGIP